MIKPDKTHTTSGTYAKVRESLKQTEATIDRRVDEFRQKIADARARRNAEETQPMPLKVAR